MTSGRTPPLPLPPKMGGVEMGDGVLHCTITRITFTLHVSSVSSRKLTSSLSLSGVWNTVSSHSLQPQTDAQNFNLKLTHKIISTFWETHGDLSFWGTFPHLWFLIWINKIITSRGVYTTVLISQNQAWPNVPQKDRSPCICQKVETILCVNLRLKFCASIWGWNFVRGSVFQTPDRDKEAVDLLLETLETCNITVNQVIICELYSAIFFSSEFVFICTYLAEW